MTKNKVVVLLILFVAVLSVSTGCKKKETVVPVSGVATYKGQPLAYCSIFFKPVNPYALPRSVRPTPRGVLN